MCGGHKVLLCDSSWKALQNSKLQTNTVQILKPVGYSLINVYKVCCACTYVTQKVVADEPKLSNLLADILEYLLLLLVFVSKHSDFTLLQHQEAPTPRYKCSQWRRLSAEDFA